MSWTSQRRNWKNRLMASGPVYCAYCIEELTVSTISVDHVIPICEGGKSRISNYLLACIKCNKERGKQYLKDKKARTGKHSCFQCGNHHNKQPCPFTIQ